MKINLSTAALLTGSLVITAPVLADCPGPNVSDAKRAYQQAQVYEKQGKQELALRSYAQSEGYVCENVNPYEADAARRAAPLGLALGSAAEKNGDLPRGDDANAKKRYVLASEYYDVAGDSARAQAARRSMQQQQAASKQTNKKRAEDLEKELGL